MLTLEFKEQTELGEMFFHDIQNIKYMDFKFTNADKELPYMMTANPSFHRRGRLGVSNSGSFHGRSLAMDKVKEIFNFSPVGILIKMFNSYFIIGKGFIAARVDNRGRGFEHDRLEILFAVTAEVGVTPRDSNDLKIYIDRKLYEPEYKRLMSVLKPYLSAHKGDILVTRSINRCMEYTFQMPAFRDARSRAEFSDLMKELFYRGMYWLSWRKGEDARLDALLKLQREKEKKDKRDLEIQDRMVAFLASYDPVITEVLQLEEPVANVSPIFSPELVQEMVDFQPGVAETQSQPATPLEETVMDIPTTEPISSPTQEPTLSPYHSIVEIQSRRAGNMRRMQELVEQQERAREALRESLGVDATRLGQTPTEGTITSLPEVDQFLHITPMEPLSMPPPDEVPPQDMVMPSDSVHVSDEEMARVLSGFSINPNASVTYSSLLHPITGQPVVESVGGEVDPDEIRAYMNTIYRPDAMSEIIDENTEIIIDENGEETSEEGISNADYLDEVRDRNEEELDNDPDQYEDADVIDDLPEDLPAEEAMRRTIERIRTTR